ncbi:unnamed protein product [Allacma fusca]|uniref:Uncharacterized protein n=1 Tax=Allacma fusca TaxID=39272 RepID=A0A8J2P703_9HEXA|nr:unnamed protein product [Allacma fusca]
MESLYTGVEWEEVNWSDQFKFRGKMENKLGAAAHSTWFSSVMASHVGMPASLLDFRLGHYQYIKSRFLS